MLLNLPSYPLQGTAISMPTVNEIISALALAESGSHELDILVASVLGWEKRDFAIRDPDTGDIRYRPQWVAPGTQNPAKIPGYTTNLDAALNLAIQVSPETGGFGWETGSASAKLGGDPIEARAPTLALCIAVIRKLAQAKNTRGAR